MPTALAVPEAVTVAVGVMVIVAVGLAVIDRMTALALGCGSWSGAIMAAHGVQFAGSSSRSTRPSLPGSPAPPPALSGMYDSVPEATSATKGQSSADGLELPPPLIGSGEDGEVALSV